LPLHSRTLSWRRIKPVGVDAGHIAPGRDGSLSKFAHRCAGHARDRNGAEGRTRRQKPRVGCGAGIIRETSDIRGNAGKSGPDGLEIAASGNSVLEADRQSAAVRFGRLAQKLGSDAWDM